MTRVGEGFRATWFKVIVLNRGDARRFTRGDLLQTAKNHWDWLVSDPVRKEQAYTLKGSCLVATLYLPRPNGGAIFISTIPRGDRHTLMTASGADTWRAANTDINNKLDSLHAEDGAAYLFETSGHAEDIVENGEYTPDRNNPLSKMVMRVYGSHTRDGLGKQIPSCIKCQRVAEKLNIVCCACDNTRLQNEAAAQRPPSRSAAPSGGRGNPPAPRPGTPGSGSRPSGQSSAPRDASGSTSTSQLTESMSSLKVSSVSKPPTAAPAKKRAPGR